MLRLTSNTDWSLDDAILEAADVTFDGFNRHRDTPQIECHDRVRVVTSYRAFLDRDKADLRSIRVNSFSEHLRDSGVEEYCSMRATLVGVCLVGRRTVESIWEVAIQ